jgi:serine/threonine-protein kinase RsbT
MNAMAEGAVGIESEGDIVVARRAVREAATKAGFGLTDITRIVTAASELARNIFQYAGKGAMHWRYIEGNGRLGLELQFVDQGPGIADVEMAMEQGYSTGDGLGMGLPGAKRLMDEMEIQSKAGQGTSITIKKWRKS